MKPILFSTNMVKAILEGKKTETRRIIKPVKLRTGTLLPMISTDLIETGYIKPPYKPGDILWVRETFMPYIGMYIYRATHLRPKTIFTFQGEKIEFKYPWKPLIFMPKKACRLFLEVISSHAERLQDITEEAALSEGIERSSWEYSCKPYRNYNEPRMSLGKDCSCARGSFTTPRASFATLWNSINRKPKKGKPDISWKSNPFVWVIKFEIREIKQR